MGKYLFFFIFTSLFLLFSCKNKERENYIEQIEKLNVQVEQLQKEIQDLPQQQNKEIQLKVEQTIDILQGIIQNDTISIEFVERINQYKDIPNVLSINSGNLAKVKSSLPEVKEKLKQLQHDIENGVNERDQYENFISFEHNKITEIENVLSYYILIEEKYHHRYDSLQPLIDDFIANRKEYVED